MTGRRETKKAAIRQRILKAALDLFQSKGFDATTTRAIARRARVAEGTVFNYFSTKEDIAIYFFELEVEHVIAAFRKSARLRRAPLEEQLFSLIHSQLEYLAPHEKFIGTALAHALEPGSRLGPFNMKAQESWVRYLAFVQELFDQAIKKGEVSKLAWWMPQAFLVYYMGVVFYWLHDSSPKKQNTLAFLDRSLKIGLSFLQQGGLDR